MKIRTNQTLFTDREQITERIARFWDQISEGWRLVWGQHIHHGYYEDPLSRDEREAQIKLMARLAEFVDLQPRIKVLDAGCGMGGSSLYLAKHYQAQVTGISLSAKQVAIAKSQAEEKGISTTSFQVEDALSLKSFEDHTFDLVWSLESCEQFFDKSLFLQQAFRVLKPGGKLMLATWCSGQEEYEGRQGRKYQKLCQAFDLPYMPTQSCYATLLAQAGFTLRKQEDWSRYVQQSWEQGIQLAKAYSFLKLLRIGGWRGFRFVQQLRLMRDAFQSGQVRYGIFYAERCKLGSSTPQSSE